MSMELYDSKEGSDIFIQYVKTDIKKTEYDLVNFELVN